MDELKEVFDEKGYFQSDNGKDGDLLCEVWRVSKKESFLLVWLSGTFVMSSQVPRQSHVNLSGFGAR